MVNFIAYPLILCQLSYNKIHELVIARLDLATKEVLFKSGPFMDPRERYFQLRSSITSGSSASPEAVLEAGMAALMCYELNETAYFLNLVQQSGYRSDALSEAIARALYLTGEIDRSKEMASYLSSRGFQDVKSVANILNPQTQEPAQIELESVGFDAPYGTLYFHATMLCPDCGVRFSYSWLQTYLIHRVIHCPLCLSSILLTYDAFAKRWKDTFYLSKEEIKDLDDSILDFSSSWYKTSSVLERDLGVHSIDLGSLLKFSVNLFLSNLAYSAVASRERG